MNSRLVVVSFILFFSNCQCGLLGWFNEWTDQLEEQNANRKCRERRDIGENGIKPEITNSAQGEMVSLADIEEGRLTDETDTRANSKTKRCPKDGFTRLVGKSILGFPQTLPLVKRDLDELNEERCKRCTRNPNCILFKKCEQCKKYCGFIPAFVNDSPMLQEGQVVPQLTRMAPIQTESSKSSKMIHRVGSYRNDLKNIICRIVGIPDTNDIDSIIIFATTFSNVPPEIRNYDQKFHQNESNENAREGIEQQLNEDNFHAENMPSDLNKKKHGASNLKPRFNDYDSGEDVHTFSKLRSLEPNVKENPDLIEGPPPFVGTSHNDNEKQIGEMSTVNSSTTQSRNDDNIVGASNEDVVVQPEELISESEESDEDEVLPEAAPVPTETPVIKPLIFNKLRDIQLSRTKPLQRLKSLQQAKIDAEELAATPIQNPESNIFTSTQSAKNSMIPLSLQKPSKNAEAIALQNVDTATKAMSGISKALEDVKAIVENIQEKAQRASEKPILGASRLGNSPSDLTPENEKLVQPVIPPEVLDNIKDVNRYLINRVHDALETINDPQNSTERDHHSALTKQTILNAKKVPAYFMEKVQDSMSHFEKNMSAEFDGVTDILNNLPENILSTEEEEEPELKNKSNKNEDSARTTTENEAIVGFTEPVDSSDNVPAINQYKTKLEKYLSDLKNRRQKLYSPEKFTEGPILTPSPSKDLNEKSRASNPVMSPRDIAEQKQILRNKLKAYIDSMLSRRTTTEAPVENSLLGMEEDVTEDYFGATPFNLSEQTDQAATGEDFTTKAKISEAAPTETPAEFSSKLATNKHVSPFRPTLPSVAKNPLKQFFEELRAKSQVKPLESKMPDFGSRFGSDDEPVAQKKINENGNAMRGYQSSVIEPRKQALKEKLKLYLDAIKKPLESRINQPTDSSAPQFQKHGIVKKIMDEMPAETISTPADKYGDNDEERTPTIEESPNKANFEDEGMRVGAMQPPLNQMEGKRNVDMESRTSFNNEEVENDWQSTLGKLVQYSSKPQDIFFSGNGIKLPMKLKLSDNGAVDLSVDLEKLCSCKNSSCPKNHTEIEQTLGTILEKEAELENQLKDATNIEPLKKYHTKRNFIFKRSSELGAKPEATTPKGALDNIKNGIVRPKLPLMQDIASDLSQFDQQLQKEFADSLQQIQNNADKLNKDVLSSLIVAQPNYSPGFPADTLEAQMKKFKDLSDQNVKHLLKSFQDNSLTLATQSPLLATEEYIKRLEKEKSLKKLLRQMHPTYTSPQGREIQNQARAITQDMEQQNRMNQLKNQISAEKLKMTKLWTTQNPLAIAEKIKENLRTSLPGIPKLQNRVTDINDNFLHMSDALENSKINALEHHLEKLNNDIEKYEESNGKLFAGDSRRFFGGHNNDVIQKEVNLIGKTLSWLNSLAKSKT